MTSQTEQGYPENVSYEGAQVAFVAVHIVDSNNSLAPGPGHRGHSGTDREVLGRTVADIAHPGHFPARQGAPGPGRGVAHPGGHVRRHRAGSPWPTLYALSSPAANLSRVTVEGSTAVDEWLKVSVPRRGPGVLSIQRVPYTE